MKVGTAVESRHDGVGIRKCLFRVHHDQPELTFGVPVGSTIQRRCNLSVEAVFLQAVQVVGLGLVQNLLDLVTGNTIAEPAINHPFQAGFRIPALACQRRLDLMINVLALAKLVVDDLFGFTVLAFRLLFLCLGERGG